MFLKRLDVIGFKSFAERISIEFVPGVTAVVGPNGSGKSNVIDAVRWVLGEQSAKHLRGGKMEDVIFAGSDARKPLNFAEVTLTLDNGDHALPIDYQEVSVTRRVYRSGDSEFFINKQQCRLKDIIELFMDSGLGKEAFSIISQGKVEEILNSKAEERRTIFEEAAGVLKYKTRKKKAETKLAETQENLNRVSDILYELESQIEPLQIQASIAKDYLEQKEALKNYEIAVMVHEIEDLHGKWELLQTQLAEHRDKEAGLASEIRKQEAHLEEKRNQLDALDESISALQNVLLATTEELEKLEGQKEVLKERKKNAGQNKAQLERNIKESANTLEALAAQKEKLLREVGENEKAVASLRNSVKEKQEQLALLSTNLEEKIESLKSDYIELLNGQASAKNEKNYLKQQLKQFGYRIERLDADNRKYVEEREKIQEKKKVAGEQLEKIQQELEEAAAAFVEKKRKLEILNNRYQKQESNLYKAYQYLQKAKSRKETLEEMEEDFTGFYQGVREVLKARGKQLDGIEGAVAELIRVPSQYEKAIETALGASMQHIVVETEHHGRRAIAFLKQRNAGRATFLPLNIMKPKTIPASQLAPLQNEEAYIGIAGDIVQSESRYRTIVSNLLGNVLVVRDLKSANQIAKMLGYRYRIVTLDGDIVNPGGSMTGGASKQNGTSLLGRKSELEALKEKLADMEAKTLQLESDVKGIKAEAAWMSQELEETRKNGESLRLREQQAKSELERLEIEEKNMNEHLLVYDMEKAEAEEQNRSARNRIRELEGILAENGEKAKKLESEIETLTEKKNDDSTARSKLQAELSDLKASLAVKMEQWDRNREELGRLGESIREWRSRKESYEEQYRLLTDEESRHHMSESELVEAAEQKARDKNDTIEFISIRREERVQLQAEIEDLELGIKELKRQQKGLQQAIQDEEVRANRLDVELENRLSRLREEYTLTFEAAKEAYTLPVPLEEARKKVKLIKLAIDELGTVNLGAIEEYDRISERYRFLKEQETDLLEAKETLDQVITEMDGEMIRRFDETFKAIRNEFEPVFRELFGGGRADLRLTDPKDLLNTGVEIVAQPPGKKLQNLGLLSGGERALTAIALLFAILRVRPVPFCILDEVEAALDEANVYRFSKYLKQFSEETQFIVITHRKGTMEEADVLYGVTMQESGVSKLVSVKLEESADLVGQT
ncbi:chromosome partition protein Smc [Weizmannia acidilactici]|uniref:chromosome segregation protein SMC n=1 Tax=Weizmannia acidilactici TaxID=2607726 RepID=UPI00124BE831|nr:chromosome segregation protein SMC [Weizmannia acidilactici]GER65594.1 chromosome partition protein Smc [Weizmannia acidilactici]